MSFGKKRPLEIKVLIAPAGVNLTIEPVPAVPAPLRVTKRLPSLAKARATKSFSPGPAKVVGAPPDGAYLKIEPVAPSITKTLPAASKARSPGLMPVAKSVIVLPLGGIFEIALWARLEANRFPLLSKASQSG